MFDLIYFALEYFATVFQDETSQTRKIMVFAGYCAANVLIKATITSLGHKLDSAKRGSASLY